MSLEVVVGLAGLFGLYMAWTIGANDVANAMGTSVGSGALTLKQAILVAAVLEFTGAVLAGGEVTDTVRKKILDPEVAFVRDAAASGAPDMGNMTANATADAVMPGGGAGLEFAPELYIFGMLAALLGTALWLTFATWKGWPVSTTHSIVGGVIGAGMFAAGTFYGWDHAGDAVAWDKVIEIFQSWLFAPLLGGSIAFALFWFIKAVIFNSNDPLKAVDRWRWLFIFLDILIIALATLVKGLKNVGWYKELGWIGKDAAGNTVVATEAWLASVGIAAAVTIIAEVIIRVRQRGTPHPTAEAVGADTELYKTVEKRFIALQIVTAGSVAFAHGANDVANAIGPLAGIVAVAGAEYGTFPSKASLPLWVLLVGGTGIVIGLATWGWRVMQTIGQKISEITPSRGFAAELAAAATIILATTRGIPVSTSQILVGSVLGVGLARGVAAIDLKVMRDIVFSWLLTLPAAGLLAGLLYLVFKTMSGL
ncbi:MAG: inorganic phosphate transporter [Thermoplasmatota archaeon]